MSVKQVKTTKRLMDAQHKASTIRKDRTIVSGCVDLRRVTRSCTASLKTRNDLKTVKGKSGTHNHPSLLQDASPSPVAATPPATPTQAESQYPNTDPSPCKTPSPTTQSLTELLSPYTTITPLPPKYDCLKEENSHLRQRVAELQYLSDAMTNRAIELEQQLMQFKEDFHSSFGSSQPYTSNTVQPLLAENSVEVEEVKILKKDITSHESPCGKCKIFQEEASRMIDSIRCLEEEIRNLKNTVSPVPPSSSLPSSTIPLHNSYAVLSQPDGEEEKDEIFKPVNRRRSRKKKNKPKATTIQVGKYNKKYKISHNYRKDVPIRNVTVVGDSHCRGLSSLLNSMTTDYTRTTGVCKPGAGLLDIAPSTTPPDDHCYVLLAGTNDIAAGRQDTIFQNMETVIQNCTRSSRVLVSPILPRHDLPSASPIHEHVALANNFISELCHRQEGVEILDLCVLERRHFTRHGLHLNAMGKIILSNMIVKQLSSSPPRCRPAMGTETTPPSLPAQPSTMVYNTYKDAVINSPTSEAPVQADISTIRQTDSKINKIFLGNPPLAEQNN